MQKNRLILLAFLWIIFAGCNQKSEAIKGKYFDIIGFFNTEIQQLNQTKPGLEKIISREENPQSEQSDTANWAAELEPFFQLDINKPTLADKYEITVDSNKGLQIKTYYAKDTNTEVQRISITTLNTKIQLVEAETRKRSWIVDRDVKYSYMPGKGYGIIVKENYIWSSPNNYEIFAQIINKKELYR